MANRILAGNVTHSPLDGWANECAVFEPGLDTYQYVGWGKLTTTPQTIIDLVLPSRQKRKADKPLIVPNGATIYRISLRLPREIREDEQGLGRKYGLLEYGAKIIGNSGDNFKVAKTAGTFGNYTATNPTITCGANDTYAPNASDVQSATEWGALAAPLGLTAADTPFKFYCSNTGNTAAGTGISVSKGVAFVLAEICFKLPAEAIDFERAGYPIMPDDI
jgi:hypothetical protein